MANGGCDEEMTTARAERRGKTGLSALAFLVCACLSTSLWAWVELKWGESFDLPMLANMEVHSIYDQFQRFLGVLTGGLGCLFCSSWACS